MLYKLIYISRATADMADEELEALLKQSREKNARLQITGLLVYANQQFMQVLEGEKDEVRKLYDTICADDRNTGNRVVTEGPIAGRTFPGWSMAFKNLDRIRINEFGDISKMLTKGFYSASASDMEPFVQAVKVLL